jgi:hypothetical protein
MRQSPFFVAALLAFTMLLTGGALAFDIDSVGSTKPDGTPRYADPDENLNLSGPSQSEVGQTGTSKSVTLAPGLYLSGSSTGNGASSGAAGTSLLPMGRLTH